MAADSLIVGIITKAIEPTTVKGINNNGIAIPVLKPNIYMASEEFIPFAINRKGTAIAVINEVRLLDALDKVIGVEDFIIGFIKPLGGHNFPLYILKAIILQVADIRQEADIVNAVTRILSNFKRKRIMHRVILANCSISSRILTVVYSCLPHKLPLNAE